MTDERPFDTNRDTRAAPPDALAADTAFLIARDCPLMHGGQNLVYLRRVRLREIAKELRLDPDGSKNALLHRILQHKGFSVRSVKRMTGEQFAKAQTEVLS